MLNTILHGAPSALPPLLIAHGLYGSARNWGVIAKRLADERQVVAVDMRNHGQSPRQASHSYPEMAEDLAGVLALNHPEMVRRLVVADIAPVAYGHTQIQFIEAMRKVDLNGISRRSEAQAQLAELGVEPALQSFFTQSLDLPNKRWLLNLDVLADQMPSIMSFPETDAAWDGIALFLSGAASDYVRPDHRDRVKARFPNARFAKIPGAGHWLHAEKPREFEAAVRAFLNA